MKSAKTMLVAALVAGSLFASSNVSFAQPAGGGGGGGGRGGRGGVLTQEQNQQMRDAMQDNAEMTALNTKLAAAQKEAINAALAKDASEATVREKVKAVAAIQTDIAVLRYTKAVKPVAASITAEQKTQIEAAPGMVYGQFFGGGGAGGFGGRRGGGPGGPGGPGAN